MTRHKLALSALLLATALGAFPAYGQADAGAPAAAEAVEQVDAAKQLLNRVTEAYRNQKYLDETTTFVQKATMGEQSRSSELQLHTTLEGAAGRARVGIREATAATDMLVVVMKDEKVYAKFNGPAAYEDRYLQADLKSKATYDQLAEKVPVLHNLVVPTLIFAMAENPVESFTGDPTTRLTHLGQHPDNDQLVGLSLTTGPDTTKMWFDSKSHLLSRIDLPIPADIPAGIHVEMYATTKIHDQSAEKADDAFAFATEGLNPVEDYIDLVKLPAHPLEGKDAPPIALKSPTDEAFTLADAPKDTVYVFDFWATWCGPCVESMPSLHDFAKWAKDNDKPVQVYAVNVEETKDDVTAFWSKHKFTLPILMDTEGAAARAYGVQGIPMTVMVHNGKVKYVQVGYRPGIDKVMQREVDSILAAKPAASAEVPATPATP